MMAAKTAQARTLMSDATRLLIIDDDEFFCQVTARAMTRRGYEVKWPVMKPRHSAWHAATARS